MAAEPGASRGTDRWLRVSIPAMAMLAALLLLFAVAERAPRSWTRKSFPSSPAAAAVTMAVMGSVLAATHLWMRSTVGFRLTLLVYDAGIVPVAVLLSRAAQPRGLTEVTHRSSRLASRPARS